MRLFGLEAIDSQFVAIKIPSVSGIGSKRSEGSDSDFFHQAQSIVDGRVGVAGRHGVADPEQLEASFGIGDDVLCRAGDQVMLFYRAAIGGCLLYTSPSPRDRQKSRMPSSA